MAVTRLKSLGLARSDAIRGLIPKVHKYPSAVTHVTSFLANPAEHGRQEQEEAAMKLNRPNGYVLILFFIVITVLALVGAARPYDDPAKPAADKKIEPLIHSLDGADLYRAYCASCHGTDGKGHGPVVPALSVRVPDLTTIAQRNHGLFPAERVRGIIAGDDVFAAHGSRDMPIWGPVFHQVENDRDYGNIRLKSVTEYLKSIQQK